MNKWSLLLVLGLLWAPSFIFIKIGLQDGIPPITLAAGRITLAAIILYVVLKVRGGTLPRSWQIWRKFAVMGFFATAFPFALFAIGEQFSESALAAIFNGATPIATAAIAHFFIDDERLNPARLIGVLTGFAGILTIFLPGLLSANLDPANVWGMAAFAVAAVSYGVSLVYARKQLRGLAPLVAPTAQVIISSLMLIPAAILFDPPMEKLPGVEGVGAVVFLAVFGTTLAYVVYYKLLEIANATFLSLVTYFLPPVGVFLSVIFMDEQLGWNALAGCALISCGLLLMNGVIGHVSRRFRRSPVLPLE